MPLSTQMQIYKGHFSANAIYNDMGKYMHILYIKHMLYAHDSKC